MTDYPYYGVAAYESSVDDPNQVQIEFTMRNGFGSLTPADIADAIQAKLEAVAGVPLTVYRTSHVVTDGTI